MIITIYQAGGSQQQYVYKQKQHKIVIGRNPKPADGTQQTITIDEPTASRRHLQIKLKNNKLFIRDLKSSNGTKVNSKRIDPEQWLQLTADLIQIVVGQSQAKITIQRSQPSKSEDQSPSSHQLKDSRSRDKLVNKQKQSINFESLCKQLKISNSTLKTITDMLNAKKSKQQIIKFLKLMGCKNIQQHWTQIHEHLTNKSRYQVDNIRSRKIGQKTNEQLQRQFDLGRNHHEKKGLGL